MKILELSNLNWKHKGLALFVSDNNYRKYIGLPVGRIKYDGISHLFYLTNIFICSISKKEKVLKYFKYL
jgi:hypothetical protein